jgi:hypothetical protein
MTGKVTITNRLRRLGWPLNKFRDWLETASRAKRVVTLITLVAMPTALGLTYVLIDGNLIALGVAATASYAMCTLIMLMSWMNGMDMFDIRPDDMGFYLFVLVSSTIAYLALRTFVVGW